MRQQEVDQGGHIADVDRTVQVAVGVLEVEAGGVVREQVVDQCRHVADVDIAVAAVTSLMLTLPSPFTSPRVPPVPTVIMA